MPTYTYQCIACSHVFHYVREIARRNDPMRCPACGYPNAERRLDAPAVNMNGQEAAK